MFKNLFSAALLASLLFIAGGCKDDPSQYMKTVSGKAGEVIVVIDKESWQGDVGNALRQTLAEPYPQLPQSEPAFNLINITKNAFGDLFKVHRNIIYARIEPSVADTGVFVRRDVWAQPQIVIELAAQNGEQAARLIEKNSQPIFNAIDQIEKERIANSTRRYEEPSIRSVVTEKFGGSPYFPKGYSIKKVTEDFVWVASESTYTNLGILIFTMPYDGVQFPSLDEIIEKQNQILQKNVPGMFPNSYMTTSTAIPPTMTPYKYKDKDYVEIRGLWEVANDYMGGPFVEHVLYAQDSGKLLVIEGFVYAPRYRKRNYVRQVESIVYSFEWAKDQTQ